MVKRNQLSSGKKALTAPGILLCCAAAALLNGCLAGRQIVELHPESLVIPAGSPGTRVSLARWGDDLLAVYSDKATTTLNMVRIPVAERLPDSAPAATIIDKIDVAPPLSPRFGEHILTVHDGTAGLMYQDRESDTKTVLKAAERKTADSEWSLDVLEPAGDLVALLPSDNGGFDAFWAAESLLFRRLRSAAAPATYLTPFARDGAASIAGDSCFTAFNASVHALLAVRRNGSGFTCTQVPGAGAVQSSLLAEDGTLSILSWESSSRRLVLFEQKPGEAGVAKSIVTLCDNTDCVALLPGSSPRARVFLFDEGRLGGGTGIRYQLSLIAPGSLLGKGGSRYSKAILTSGDAPVSSFSAVITGGALYALVLQKDLTLIRVGLKP